MHSLRWPRLDRVLRRRVQREVRASPHLRAEFKRHRTNRLRQALPAWTGQLVFALGLAAWWGMAVHEVAGLGFSLALLALWSLIGVAMQAAALRESLYASPHLPALYLLPLSDQQVFQTQGRVFARRSWALMAWHLPAGLVLSQQLSLSPAAMVGCLLLPPAQAALFTAVAVHCEARWPRGWHRHFGKLWVLLIAGIVGWQSLDALASSLAPVGYWVPPFGWLNWAFFHGALGGDAWAMTLLIPASIPLWTLPWSWERLRSRYEAPAPAPDWTDSSRDAAAENSADALGRGGAAPAEMGPTEIEEWVRSGQWRSAFNWEGSGWLERWLARRFTVRQRLVAEFLTGGHPSWSPPWRWVCLGGGLAAAAVLLFGGYGLLAGFLVLASTAPVLGGTWTGLRSALTGSMRAPLYSVYPFGFGEMAGVMLTVNLARYVVATPLVLVMGALGGWKLEAGALAGAALALKAVGFLIASQPAVVVFRFSADTADTHQLRWFWMALLIGGVLGLVASGGVMLTAPAWEGVLAALGAAAALALGILWFYARLWGRSRFDLLSPPATE